MINFLIVGISQRFAHHTGTQFFSCLYKLDGNADFQPFFIRRDLVPHPIDSHILRTLIFQVPGHHGVKRIFDSCPNVIGNHFFISLTSIFCPAHFNDTFQLFSQPAPAQRI